MPEWITYILIPLVSALIGGGLTMLGVIVTIKWEAKQKKQENIEKALPIIINVSDELIPKDEEVFRILFESDGDDKHTICGMFKNTDNGILFLDSIKTETKEYLPVNASTVEKNTYFSIIIRNIAGENLKNCNIHCHDIYGNKYTYDAYFDFEIPNESRNFIKIRRLKPFKPQQKK